MKKIKMMLLSVALFAVVGGALAFKAKFGDTDFCVKQVTNGTSAATCALQKCPTAFIASTFDVIGTDLIYCTTPKGTQDCTADRNCSQVAATTIIGD